MFEEEKLLKELSTLRQEHASLDGIISHSLEIKDFDQLTIQRLKKRKLWIKDRISTIESNLYPDIIA